jgi:hypothetical protein
MEIGIVDPVIYDVLLADALAEARDHADAETASARDDGDALRAVELRRLVRDLEDDLDGRLMGAAGQITVPW